jgi:hypothetical protein
MALSRLLDTMQLNRSAAGCLSPPAAHLRFLAPFGEPPMSRRPTGAGHEEKRSSVSPKMTNVHGRFTKRGQEPDLNAKSDSKCSSLHFDCKRQPPAAGVLRPGSRTRSRRRTPPRCPPGAVRRNATGGEAWPKANWVVGLRRSQAVPGGSFVPRLHLHANQPTKSPCVMREDFIHSVAVRRSDTNHPSIPVENTG